MPQLFTIAAFSILRTFDAFSVPDPWLRAQLVACVALESPDQTAEHHGRIFHQETVVAATFP